MDRGREVDGAGNTSMKIKMENTGQGNGHIGVCKPLLKRHRAEPSTAFTQVDFCELQATQGYIVRP